MIQYLIPLFFDFIKLIKTCSIRDYAKIEQIWPEQTKTKLALVRAKARATKKLQGSNND